ncbi:MAG: Xaa-Pro peptidase family protein [Pseudomonadota bacterium]
MPIHFPPEEFQARVDRAATALRKASLDAVVLFAPESHYWLTGYDTFGFAMFQAMVLDADGRIDLLTRAPDLRQARHTSTLSDDQIHIWHEREGAEPTRALHDLLEDRLLHRSRLGIEMDTPGLSARNWAPLHDMFGPWCEDASHVIAPLRRVKSPAEIEMIRKAASLSDYALEAALEITEAGAFEGDILAAMQGAVFKGGGDYAGNEFVIGSGEGALLCRYFSGRRKLDKTDQLTLEWSGAYARYHAAMMRTLITGKAKAAQKKMHAAAVEALEACEAAIRPGAPMGDVFAAHAKVFDAHGLQHARLEACGYGMGIAYNPIWVEFPMFYEGNPLEIQENQAFFLHMILMDSDAGLGMCCGHSVLCTKDGVERLSRHPLDLVEL